MKSCHHNRRCLKVQLVPRHQLTRMSMYYRKLFVHPWKIRWKFFLQHCRKMRWLWPALYGKGLRHILPSKVARTPTFPRKEHVPHHRWLAMILRGHCAKNVGTWRGRLVLPKRWFLRQANPTWTERMMMSVLDPTDSFSDPEQQAVPTLPNLDRATADFKVEETTGPPLSEAMALRVGHILKTPLLPEKLKFRMDRELCPSNALSISAEKVIPSLFNKRGGGGGDGNY